MKTLKYLFLSILFIIGCQSCDPDPLPGPEPTVYFTVTATAGIGGTITPAFITVKHGESAILNINKNSGYMIKSIKLNGSEIAISDQIKIDNITANQNVIVEFITIDLYNLTKGSDTKTNPWHYHAIEFYTLDNVFKYRLNLVGDIWLTYNIYFYLNGKMEGYDQQDVFLYTNNWSLSGKTYTYCGEVYTVVEISDKVFSYQRIITQNDGTQEYERTVFWK